MRNLACGNSTRSNGIEKTGFVCFLDLFGGKERRGGGGGMVSVCGVILDDGANSACVDGLV